jgi:hypothetical protein
VCGISHLEFLTERGGLYCFFFRNSLVFCHFIRKTRNFCRLRTSLSSLFRLSSALQSLLWTSKVPKKSNISNNPDFPVGSTRTQGVFNLSWGNPIISILNLRQARHAPSELSTSDRSTLADFTGLILPRKPDSRSPSHSLRKTSIGSTASARKLGTTFAASATSRNSAVTPASVAGSVALIP